MMFVGYALDHPSGIYEMYNPGTKRIITTDSVEFASFKRWKTKGAMPDMYEDDEDVADQDDDKTNKEVEIKLEDVDEDNDKDAAEDVAGMSTNSKKATSLKDSTRHSTKTTKMVYRYNTRSKAGQDVQSGGNTDTTDAKLGGTEPTTVHREGNYKVTGDTNVTRLTMEEIGTEPMGINFIKLGGKDDHDELDDLINQIYNVSINGDPGEPANIWEAINDEQEGELWKKSATAECRCDPNFLVLWKLDEWAGGNFHDYVREDETKYFAFVKFCVPIVTGVKKWKNDLKSAIWNRDRHTLKSCGMLSEAEEGFTAMRFHALLHR